MRNLTLEEEKKLVAKAKESLTAFSKLYEHYLPRIFSYVVNRVSDKKIAEDLTADTFMKAMKKIDKFEYRGYSFGSWLYRIAHNIICDYHKKNKNVFPLEKTEIVHEVKNDYLLDKLDQNHKIRQVLNRLKEDYQQVLTLKFFEELTNPEIAEVLGCSTNALNVKLHRSQEAFRKHYHILFDGTEEISLL